MDHWIHDGSLFISRKLGSPEGVVQVYRCWSLDTPMGDNSFSLIGETSSPSEIAPSTVWGQRDYLRLLEFLEVNSAMVNVRGHFILRSLVKSLRAGRADGPETYWRCLDVLPMQAFSLVRPADTHGAPQFLITGEDVLATTTPTPTPAKVIVDVGDWRGKYDKLEVEFKQLKLEVSTLKDTLGRVSDTLIDSQSENEKLVKEIEDLKSENKQTRATLQVAEAKRDSAEASLVVLGVTLTACQTENEKLVREIEDQTSASKQIQATLANVEVERDSIEASLVAVSDALTACQTDNKNLTKEIEDLISASKLTQDTLMDVEAEQDSVKASLANTLTENKKLTRKIEGQKSANKQLEARIRDVDSERQKAVEEAEKLKIKVSKLDIQVRESVSKAVLNDTVEREMDRWTAYSGSIYLAESYALPNTINDYVPVNELFIGNFQPDLTNYHKVIDYNCYGKWSIYRDGYDVFLRRERADPADPQGLHINRMRISHLDVHKTGKLYGMFRLAQKGYDYNRA